MPTVRAALRAAHPKRLPVGRTLSTSFVVWARNLIPFFLIVLFLNAPLLVYEALLFHRFENDELSIDTYMRYGQILSILRFLVLQRLLTGTVTFAVVENLRGRRIRLTRCIALAVRRLGKLVVVATVAGAASALPLVLWVFGVDLYGPTTRLLLLVPTLILAVLFFVADTAVMVERPRYLGLQALGRSVRLTVGSRLRICGLIILLVVVYRVGHVAIWLVVTRTAILTPLHPLFYVPTALALLALPLYSVVQAVAYYELRMMREGVDLDAIAGVFD